MKLRLLSPLFFRCCCPSPPSPAAQIPTIAPPPIKMGLWQSSVTVNMSGMPNNPNMPSGAGGGSMTHVNQSCMTPDSWRDAFRNMQQRASAGGQRQLLHSERLSGCHQVTFDMNCSSQQAFTSNVHVQMLLDSEESDARKRHGQMSGPNFPRACR